MILEPADMHRTLASHANMPSPALTAVQELILAQPDLGIDPGEALNAARVLLAAHARELADVQHAAARERGAEMRERGDRSRVAHCGGRHAVIADLRRYADDLDQQAAGGAQ